MKTIQFVFTGRILITFKFKTMKYLLFNWDDLPDGLNLSDPSDLTDVEFEKLATDHGIVIDSHEDFEAQFNAEMFSVHTHQLRIIK